jgi:hypothetical protein
VMQAIQCPGVNHEEAFDVENPEANVAVKKKKKLYVGRLAGVMDLLEDCWIALIGLQFIWVFIIYCVLRVIYFVSTPCQQGVLKGERM